MDSQDKQNPLVSVIIPVYNRGHLLPRTIKSVLNQTYKNLEILVVDDGSSEDIKSIAESFSDQRIRYLRHDANRGICAARNTGIRAARGEFISFLDSDDEYLPEKIEKQVKVFTENGGKENPGMVYCGILEETGKGFRPRCSSIKMDILPAQTMTKKNLAEKAGLFDEEFTFCEDTEFIYRLAKICRFAGIKESLTLWRYTPDSHSKKDVLLNEYTERFLAKHSAVIPQGDKSRWFYRIGSRYIRAGRLPEGYRSFYRAFIAYPLNERAFRKLIRLFPAVFFLFLKHPAKVYTDMRKGYKEMKK